MSLSIFFSAHHKRNLEAGICLGTDQESSLQGDTSMFKNINTRYWTVSCRMPFWQTAKENKHQPEEVPGVSLMLARKKIALRLESLAAVTTFVSLCVSTAKSCLANVTWSESPWSPYTRNWNGKAGMKIHCARTSSTFPCAANQPRETQSRQVKLWDPQGCAVQPRVSTSIKSTQYRPVHPPREQLKTVFHTIIQGRRNIWQLCAVLFGWDCSCSSHWAVCVSCLMAPTAKWDLDSDH